MSSSSLLVRPVTNLLDLLWLLKVAPEECTDECVIIDDYIHGDEVQRQEIIAYISKRKRNKCLDLR